MTTPLEDWAELFNEARASTSLTTPVDIAIVSIDVLDDFRQYHRKHGRRTEVCSQSEAEKTQRIVRVVIERSEA